MMKIPSIAIASAVFGPVLCLSSAAFAQWTLTDLSPTGSTSAFALGNSATNQVGQNGSFAALWSGTSASWVNINPSDSSNIPAGGSRCYAAFGTQQGGFARWNTKTYAGIWSGSAGSWVNLHPTGVGGAGNSIVYGMCATQQVGSHDATGTHACLWSGTPGSWVDLHPVSTPYGLTASSTARGTNGTNQVGYILVNPPGINHASLWSGTPESWVDLSPPGFPVSFANGISPDGTQVVGSGGTLGIQFAGLWSGTPWAWQSLHPTGATSSQAWSTDGAEQVGFAAVGGADHASLWQGTAGTWVDLHPLLSSLGVSRSRAWAIWNDGATTTIAGECWSVDTTNPTIRTFTKAFLLTRANCDSIDYNGDGLFPDTADIDDFLSVFSGGPCSTGTCGDIDFNNDGLYPDTADIDALLSVFSGGACV